MQPAGAAPSQAGKTESRRKLILWGTLIVVAHYVAVLWHVILLVKVQPSFPETGIVLLLLINLLPMGGLLAFAKGFPKSAAAMVVGPLGIAVVIGGYTHFLSSGADNVLRMPPGPLALPFQVSAVLLVMLEVLGCWIALRMFAVACRA